MDSLTIREQKDMLRKKIRVIKRGITPLQIEIKSATIQHQIEQMPEFTASSTVFVYMALPDEVQTLSLINDWLFKKKIVLPVIKGETLELKEYSHYDSLEEGSSFGILEPRTGAIVALEEIDFAIIPGLAFDRHNNRLGRGKAYYDKLLQGSRFYKVGVCFLEQLVDNVPVDQHDVKMDEVIVA